MKNCGLCETSKLNYFIVTSVDYVRRITGSFLGVTIYYLAYKCLGIDYDVMLTNVK